MDRSSKLKPGELTAQSNGAISILDSDMSEYNALSNAISTFSTNTEIESTSFDNLRYHLSDYLTCVTAVNEADQIDKADFQALITALGSATGDIDGADILDQKDEAEANKAEAAQKALEYKDFRPYYQGGTGKGNMEMANYYDGLAADYQAIIDWCNEQIDTYDQIEAQTAHLFQMGGGIRSAASAGIADLSGAFQNGNYVPNPNAKWKTDLLTAYTGGMIVYKSDGTYEFNWDKVKEVLGRDADLISEAEYRALAGFYLAIDDEDIDDFILECLNSGEDKIIYTGSDPNLKKNNYHRWTVNEEKLDNILLFVNLTSNQILESEKTALASFKKSRSDEDKTLFEEYQSMNYDVLQRAALLSSVKEINEFHDDLDNNKPHLNITTEEKNGKKDIILEYYGNQKGSDYFVTKGTCTATVHGTLEGTGVTKFSIDLAENAMLSCFDAELTTLDKGGEAATDYAVGYVRDEVVSHMTEEIGKKFGKVGIGVIPVIGDIAVAGYEFAVEESERKENIDLTVEAFDSLRGAHIYSDLNCRAVYTTYDSYNLQDTVSVQVTPSVDTDERIEILNAEFDVDLTVQELIDAPQDFSELKNVDVDKWNNALQHYD